MPTRSTMPPRMSGSTVLVDAPRSGRSARRSGGRAPRPPPGRASTALVTSTGSRRFSWSQSTSNWRRDAEDDRHAVVLDQQLEEVHERRVRVHERALEPLLLLLGREVGREEEDRSSRFCSSASANCAELLLDRVELAVLLGDLEQRARVDLCDLLQADYLPSRRLAGRAPRSRARRAPPRPGALVAPVERLAGHLLGRQHGQVRDLVADLLDRAPRLGLDVAARLLEQLLALLAGRLERLALVLLGRLARARTTISSDCCARLAQPLAVLLEQLRAPPRARARTPRSPPRSPSGACRAPPGCAGTRTCAAPRGSRRTRSASRSSAPARA